MTDAGVEAIPTYEVGRLAGAVLDSVGTVVVGKRDVAGAGAGRHPGRRPRAAGGPARAGQDADRPLLRPGARAGLPPAAVHPRPAARRRHRLVPLRPAQAATSPSGPARSSPTCCSPTRSTGRRRRPRRRCWRRCRRSRSRSRASPTGWTRRSTCSPPPTRSSTRAPTRCPRPSSTGSCCGCRSATRPPTRSGTVLRRRMARRREEAAARAGGRRRHAAGDAGRAGGGRGRGLRSAATSSTLTAATREHPSVLVGASPRGSLALLLLARARAVDGRPRLRGARGRQGGGGARAGAPDHAAAGDVAAPGRPRRFVVQEVLARGARPGQRGAARRTPAGTPSVTVDRRLRAAVPRAGAGADEADDGAGLGAHPGARPGGAAHRPAAGRSASLLGRVDLVLLAAPFAIGAAVGAAPAAARRARGATIDAGRVHLVEGGELRRGLSVGNPDVGRLRPGRGPDPHLAVAASCEQRATGRSRSTVRRRRLRPTIDLPGEALRWGRHDVGPAAARVAACDGLLACRPVRHPGPGRAGLPGDRAVRGRRGDAARRPGWSARTAPAGPARAASWPGYGRSRPGTGCAASTGGCRCGPGDLHVALDPVRPGRRGAAAARRARPRPAAPAGCGGSASVLDTTVRAAAAIAEHYLHRGDRVSLLEYGADGPPAAPGHRPPAVPDRPGVAARRARRARRPSPYDARLRRAPASPSDALVVVLTPLVDPRSADMLARLTRSGRFVVAVDTLPADAGPAASAASGRRWPPAVAAGAGEHASGQLREHGVPVVAWAGAGSLDLVLRDVARLASGAEGALTCWTR